MGIHMSRELGWTPSVWGWEGKCWRPSFPPAPSAAGDRLVGDAYTASGSLADAETRCDGLASERPVPAPSPCTGVQPPYKTVMLPSMLGELFFVRWKEGSKEMEPSVFPPRHCSVLLHWISLLERMTLLFLWCYSKGCNIYQECFLIT